MQVVFLKKALSLGVNLWKKPCKTGHLQHTATRCNTLQHTAASFSERDLQDKPSAKHCKTLQNTSTHCNTLQRSATICKIVFGKRPARPAMLRVLDTPVYVCGMAVLYVYVWHGCSTCVICLTHRFDQTLLNVQHDSCIQTIIESTCTLAHMHTCVHTCMNSHAKVYPPLPSTLKYTTVLKRWGLIGRDQKFVFSFFNYGGTPGFLSRM